MRNERRANRSGFAGIGMDHYFGIGHFGSEEVHLSFDNGKVAMSSSLKDELPADISKRRQTARVDPHVQGQDAAKRRENLLGLPTFALLVHDVALQEHAAPH